MRMADPIPTFTNLVISLCDKHPNLAYLHFVEPEAGASAEESNDFARQIWQPRPFFSANEYDEHSGLKAAEEKDVAVVYGRWFISNVRPFVEQHLPAPHTQGPCSVQPDLPLRIKFEIPLTPYDPKTFYLHGTTRSDGYSDYPFALGLLVGDVKA